MLVDAASGFELGAHSVQGVYWAPSIACWMDRQLQEERVQGYGMPLKACRCLVLMLLAGWLLQKRHC